MSIEKFPGRMLLAEANQWPEDAVTYFGNGDESHMNFHFPLMPRMFMALQMEDRFPIIDILDQTPPIPEDCQWAMFLRNHDELTLEMVTDEERDYMWRVYANDPHARINLGIRRRLAPLVGNNRRKIELLNTMLLSMPGTPIIYYGDEIGMGDNIYLGDRNGCRTPMQWSPDRNAGFSKANPQQLHLPIIIDPEYHYEAINVENQQKNLSSLLWWTRRIDRDAEKFQSLLARFARIYLSRQRKNTRVSQTASKMRPCLWWSIFRASRNRPNSISPAFPAAANGGFQPELLSRELEKSPYPIMLGPHTCYWFVRPLAARSDTRRTKAAGSDNRGGAESGKAPGQRRPGHAGAANSAGLH